MWLESIHASEETAAKYKEIADLVRKAATAADLLKRAYDLMPGPEFIPEPAREAAVRALRAEIVNWICPLLPPNQADIDWVRARGFISKKCSEEQ